MIRSHLILAAGWIAFCVLHSFFASLRFKGLARRWMGMQYRFYRLYYTLFAVVSFGAVLAYALSVPSYQLFRSNTVLLISGGAISLFGLAIMGICTAKYFMQATGLKALIEQKTSNELLITGIHRFVRHPMYAGTFIFIWGLWALFPYANVLIVDTIITAYTLVGVRFEEKKLEREFGAAYTNYKKSVPMLIPKIG